MPGLIAPIHKIFRFKACVVDLGVVIFFHFCLALCSADCCLLSSFFQKVKVDSKGFIILHYVYLRCPYGRHANSAGIIAFVPYLSENDVSPLLDLIMVRCAHRTCGSSSIQSLLLSSSHAFIPSPKLLFALSTLRVRLSKSHNDFCPSYVRVEPIAIVCSGWMATLILSSVARMTSEGYAPGPET
nr:hypothetical protein [Tanacetum cinerariifolium]